MSDIEAIRNEAAALEAETAAPAQAVAVPAVDPVALLSDEFAGLVSAMVAALSPALPSLATIYTEQTTRAAAGAVAAVCVKRGWLSSGLFGEWKEEISAAVILVPLGMATYKGVMGDLAAAGKPAEEAERVQ